MPSLERYPIKYDAGFSINPKILPKVTSKKFQIIQESVGGDAPKDVINARLYLPGIRRKKTNRKYIAKVGHKMYPSESVTEYLINRYGVHCGFKMSISHIVFEIVKKVVF